MSGRSPLANLFRRPRPDGRWSLAHPLRQPLRFIGQSMVVWPAAALAAIMMAAPQASAPQMSAIVRLALQATVVYPLVVIVAFAAYSLLNRIGRVRLAPLPLIVPMAIVAVWLATLALFLVKYLLSIAGML